MNTASEYDSRSLQHEQRMLNLYRGSSSSDGGLLQPLANACWRAASFQWRIDEDPASIRRLWEEAARTLTEGFVRRRAGFERKPDELLLAVHLSIATRSFDQVKSLLHTAPATSVNTRTRRVAGAPRLLLDGYLLTVRAIIERKKEHTRASLRMLEEARAAADYEWWKDQFPSDREVEWKIEEHEATRGLLSVIARLILMQPSPWEKNESSNAELDMPLSMEFVSLMDEALLRLDQFVDSEINHRPKLYLWLPGVALSILAERAGLTLEWLQVRHEDKQKGYERLPLALVSQ